MIQTTQLTRDFNRKRAVDSLDLAVNAGEIFGFLGPNGAGKTTTIRMLCGLIEPTSGTLAIDGRDFRTGGAHIRRISGLAPDTPPLYDYLTGWQYVAFVAGLYGVDAATRDREAARHLERFGLTDRADDLCKGYSHGMKKKLHLAAILTTQPRLLILDEPTNGLDPASVRNLKDTLQTVRDEGVTVFLSTHVLAVAEEICDRVGILSDGRLLATGAMNELRREGDESLEQIFLDLTSEAIARTDGATGAADVSE